MSDSLGVASVVAVIRGLLQNAVTEQLIAAVNGTPTISALPPDRVTVGAAEAPQVNLYLYHVSLNQGWRNADLPSRDASGQALTNPPLPLDLHFLLSAYGKGEFDSEILLGWAMQVLHEAPVLTQTMIQAALTALAGPPASGVPVTTELKAIATSTLAQQTEAIRIVPENMSTEDVWKLWTAFQATYRATAAYRASVVLIRGTQTTRQNLPVRSPPNVLVQLLAPASITGVAPALIATGETLTLTGGNLGQNGAALLQFDSGQSLAADMAQPTVMKIALPATIPAGQRLVRVVRQVIFGTPGDPHAGGGSNAASFMLLPAFTAAPPATVKVGATLGLSVTPPVGPTQDVALLIGSSEIRLPAPAPTAPATNTLNFTIPADFPVSASPLPLRVQVDGAQSRIAPDAAGQFQPSITVTS